MYTSLQPDRDNNSKLNSTFFQRKKKLNSNDLFFQPKLSVGPVDDVYEREADTVADKVMRKEDNDNITPISSIDVQRKCATCEDEEHVQRKSNANNDDHLDTSLVSNAIGTGGRPLDESTRSFMEERIGHDFSNVKIHTGAVAAKSAESINALAYTSGNNIVFNENQYAPQTNSGKTLLAHELAHVVQQGNVSQTVQRQPAPDSGSNQAPVKAQPVAVTCPTFPSSGVKVIGANAEQLASVLSVCAGTKLIIDADQKLQFKKDAPVSKKGNESAKDSVAHVINNKVGIIVDTDSKSLGTVIGAFDHNCPGRQFVNIQNIETIAKAGGESGGLDDCSTTLHEMEEAVRARELSAKGATGDALFKQSHEEGTSVENKIRKGANLSARDQAKGSTVLLGNMGGNQLLILESTVFGTGDKAKTHLNVLVCTPTQNGKGDLICVDDVKASYVAKGVIEFKSQKEGIDVFNRFASKFGFEPLKTAKP